MKYVTVLTALVGCASVSDPPGLAGSAMTVRTDGGVHVIGPDYEMDFAATGIHLPDHLLVNHGLVDLLATDGCGFESQVGYVVAPAVAAAAGNQGDAVRSQITTPLVGPAVVKVHVTFEVDYACPTAQTLSGTTDFTLFPSGRIVREDLAITPSTTQLTKVGSCGCQQETDPQNFHDLAFTTYWAFQSNFGTQVRADGSDVTEDVYAACTMYPDRAVGVAWTPQPGTSTRFHPNEAASHVLDWPTHSNTSLDPVMRFMTSAIQISNAVPAGSSDCAGVLARLADVPLKIGDTVLDTTGHDGIYRDPVPHTGAFTLAPFNVAVPPGFAISVDLGGASHATLTRAPASAQVGIAQREDADRFVIVMFDGLAKGESVTIEPKR
jgi:hypothetical protein